LISSGISWRSNGAPTRDPRYVRQISASDALPRVPAQWRRPKSARCRLLRGSPVARPVHPRRSLAVPHPTKLARFSCGRPSSLRRNPVGLHTLEGPSRPLLRRRSALRHSFRSQNIKSRHDEMKGVQCTDRKPLASLPDRLISLAGATRLEPSGVTGQ
jgi:hypothetical protein